MLLQARNASVAHQALYVVWETHLRQLTECLDDGHTLERSHIESHISLLDGCGGRKSGCQTGERLQQRRQPRTQLERIELDLQCRKDVFHGLRDTRPYRWIRLDLTDDQINRANIEMSCSARELPCSMARDSVPRQCQLCNGKTYVPNDRRSDCGHTKLWNPGQGKYGCCHIRNMMFHSQVTGDDHSTLDRRIVRYGCTMPRILAQAGPNLWDDVEHTLPLQLCQ